jgi:glucose-6-phosphate isomerase
MTLSAQQLWARFQKYYSEFPSLGLSIDLSRVTFDDGYFTSMQPKMAAAFAAMAQLEKGAVANRDENRMVGHYWLRNPELAPNPEIRREIEQTLARIIEFTRGVHSGKITVANNKVSSTLVIGIGGSALGPQFVSSALGRPAQDPVDVHFFDNTDPDGMDRALASLGHRLKSTLAIVISKSGGTKETRNGMLEAKAAFERAGLHLPSHAVAVTGVGSELDQLAVKEGWFRRFPMWDWVGGRTSETSAVGLLPAALQGIDIQRLLDGAKACDNVTRTANVNVNPAAQLALMWYFIGNGKGLKDMVIIPYKDRLELFSRYLQQLIMESLGKEKDRSGLVVNQGIAVYGNKGSTDQHAYIQQLREGLNNFFVTFIEVLVDREGKSLQVEPNVTSGDYLQGFLLGTRQALFDNGRESITLRIREVSPFSVGVLIALYERAVGFYAELININAYHQPGVEAGKKAAKTVLDVQHAVLGFLRGRPGQSFAPDAVAREIGQPDKAETIFQLCEHLSANPDHGIRKARDGKPGEAEYGSL